MLGMALKILGELLDLYIIWRKGAPNREQSRDKREMEKAIVDGDYRSASKLFRKRMRERKTGSASG